MKCCNAGKRVIGTVWRAIRKKIGAAKLQLRPIYVQFLGVFNDCSISINGIDPISLFCHTARKKAVSATDIENAPSGSGYLGQKQIVVVAVVVPDAVHRRSD